MAAQFEGGDAALENWAREAAKWTTGRAAIPFGGRRSQKKQSQKKTQKKERTKMKNVESTPLHNVRCRDDETRDEKREASLVSYVQVRLTVMTETCTRVKVYQSHNQMQKERTHESPRGNDDRAQAHGRTRRCKHLTNLPATSSWRKSSWAGTLKGDYAHDTLSRCRASAGERLQGTLHHTCWVHNSSV